MAEPSQTIISHQKAAWAWLGLSALMGLLAGIMVLFCARIPMWQGLLPILPTALGLPLFGAFSDRFERREWLLLSFGLGLVTLCLVQLLIGLKLPAGLLWFLLVFLLLPTSLCHKSILVRQEPEVAARMARLDLVLFSGCFLLASLTGLSVSMPMLPWWLILIVCAGLLLIYYAQFGMVYRPIDDPWASIGQELKEFSEARTEYSATKSFLFLLFPLMFTLAVVSQKLIQLTEGQQGMFAEPYREILLLVSFGLGGYFSGRMASTFGYKRALSLALLMMPLVIAGFALADSVLWLRVCALVAVFFAAQIWAGLPGLFAMLVHNDRADQSFGWFYSIGLLAFGSGWLTAAVSGLSLFKLGFPFSLIALLLFQGFKASRFRRSPVIQDQGATELDWEESPEEGLAAHTLTSRFLQTLARTLVEIFFGRLRIYGRENIHLDSGCIFVANHPNTFLDPLLVTALAPGRVHYWAKSTLWKFPILGSLLDRMGAIPINRRQDAGGANTDNSGAMDAAAEKLNQNAHILIFPEGVSEPGLSLKPIKTGAARLAFQAIAANDWEEEIYILPIALDYSEPTIFRSPVTVRIGEPIAISQWRQVWEQDNREAVLQVTEQLSGQLKDMLPHLDDPQLEILVKRIQRLYGERVLQILEQDDETAARLSISDAVNHYQKMDPDTLYLFYERLESYFLERERLSTPDNHPPIPISALFKILASFFSFASFGLVTNWLPYRLTGKLVEWFSVQRVWTASAKLAFGLMTFGLYYLVVGFLSWHLLGSFGTGLLLLAMCLSAFIALGAIERFAFRFSQLRTLWQAFWTQDTNEDMEAMKVGLIQDLERFRESYAFYVAREIDS